MNADRITTARQPSFQRLNFI